MHPASSLYSVTTMTLSVSQQVLGATSHPLLEPYRTRAAKGYNSDPVVVPDEALTADARTSSPSEDARVAAQFFAQNPSAALLAWTLYMGRNNTRDQIQRLAQFADAATQMNARDMRNNLESIADDLTKMLDTATPSPP